MVIVALGLLGGGLSLLWLWPHLHLVVLLFISLTVLAGMACSAGIGYCPRVPPGARNFLLAFALGALWTGGHISYRLMNQLPPVERARYLLEGWVVDVPQARDYGLRFRFKVTHFQTLGSSNHLNPPRFGATVRLSWRNPPLDLLEAVRPGHRFRFVASLKPPHGFANPGGFDYERYLWHRGVRGVGRVLRAEKLASGAFNRAWLAGARQALRHRLMAIMTPAGEPPSGAGMVIALALGLRQDVSPQEWRILRHTGTAHLMAISGLHVGLVGAFAYGLAAALWRRVPALVSRAPAMDAGGLAAIAGAMVYAALAGFSLPTQRALVMLVVVMAARWWRRELGPCSSLSLGIMGVLALDPFAPLSESFWLSFVAVAVLVMGLAQSSGSQSPRSLGVEKSPGASGTLLHPDWSRIWARAWSRIGPWVAPQFVILVAMVPLGVAIFGYVSPVGPLANLVALPITGFVIVPAVLMGTASAALGANALASVFLVVGLEAISFLMTVLGWLAGAVPIWSWWVSWPALLAAAVAGALVLAPRGFPGRWLAVVWFMPFVFGKSPTPGPGEFWITVLDVGQGLAVVVRTRSHSLLYDAGPAFGPGFDTGRTVVVPYLRHMGVEHLDLMVLSHGHGDHTGGTRSVLSEVPARRILTNADPWRLRGRSCVAPRRWLWDGIRFEILHPTQPGPGADNNDSCVLRVSIGDGSALLTGDIEASVERQLVKAVGSQLRSEVLVAAHHGSRSSSTRPFVDAVGAREVVVSAGFLNSYGFPHSEVERRFRDQGARVSTTALHGAVWLRLDASGLVASRRFRARRRYWYD